VDDAADTKTIASGEDEEIPYTHGKHCGLIIGAREEIQKWNLKY